MLQTQDRSRKPNRAKNNRRGTRQKGSSIITDPQFRRELGEYLKDKRERAGLVQKDVAIFLKLTTPQYVSNWERGQIAPSLPKLRRLIKLYRMSSSELFNFIMYHQKRIIERQLKGPMIH